MRLFGSERIAKMMDRLGLKEGEVIQHSMISKSIFNSKKSDPHISLVWENVSLIIYYFFQELPK